MKKLILMFHLLLVAIAGAQTNLEPTASKGSLRAITAAVKDSGVLSATNYSFEPYATYMPSAPKGDEIGGGILVVYNMSEHVGLGLGADYLGKFSIVSANVSLKLPIRPTASWPNFYVTPFVLTGVGTPLSGSSSSLTAIADTGAYFSFGRLWGGQFNVGGCVGKWLNAGDYSGTRYHFFAGWSKGF